MRTILANYLAKMTMYIDSTNPAGWPVEYLTIAQVRDDGESYEIKRSDGWLFIVSKHKVRTPPQPGDDLVMYGGIGYQIRGIVINGEVIFYKSREEAEFEMAQFHAYYERKYGRG